MELSGRVRLLLQVWVAKRHQMRAGTTLGGRGEDAGRAQSGNQCQLGKTQRTVESCDLYSEGDEKLGAGE